MSLWRPIPREDIELDGEDINVVIGRDDGGNIYAILKVKDVLEAMGNADSQMGERTSDPALASSKQGSVELEKIFSVMQKELSDTWERYEGAELDDDLEEYGELYEKAYAKAKQAITALHDAEIEYCLPKKRDPNSFANGAMKSELGTSEELFDKGYNQAIDDFSQRWQERRNAS